MQRSLFRPNGRLGTESDTRDGAQPHTTHRPDAPFFTMRRLCGGQPQFPVNFRIDSCEPDSAPGTRPKCLVELETGSPTSLRGDRSHALAPEPPQPRQTASRAETGTAHRP